MLNIDSLPWDALHDELDRIGFAMTQPVLERDECEQLSALYDTGTFRSRIEMARHRFGEGEYKYFDHPLPDHVSALRHGLYPHLAHAANRWAERLGEPACYPETLEDFLATCHDAGQTKPTPLILRYRPGGYNALHQDLYGDVAFPFQALTVLSRKGEDFDGGESVLVEQRPRAQSRAHVISLGQGELLLFPTRHRPAAGSRGHYRATMRHGVATLTRGERLGLGVIFHDAR
ncbi:2OG-Fe(II) oxygenase [Candidatus Solirubrobacter pratensis]|uniref:2OG-Fe(II) oxygenase n=1 Tax=Candidatus Solirubrobacter pratensis TaxID=1298857 RepID=UPI00040A647C|nr:2OG-Fe(II) oxygenase [Candidatus Solirubrobacter pratensis]